MLSFRALLAACLPALALADVYSLSDLSWTLRNSNGSIVIPAKVPSQAHLDLLAAGIIEACKESFMFTVLFIRFSYRSSRARSTAR